MNPPDLLLAFYGDDFTGSTDALESLVTQGIPAMLFLDPPDPATWRAHHPHVRAIGVAGNSRSLTPSQMRDQLPAVFAGLAALEPEFLHYKVCSTYDSSPEIGNIGVAMELAAEALQPTHLLALGGAPHLGRYLAFGNLFARYGGDGLVYRIDRHPVMRNHPTTPMHESDLMLHLGSQTETFEFRNVAFDELRGLDARSASVVESFTAQVDDPSRVAYIVDALEERDERAFAHLCRALRGAGGRPFLVGPSSVERALATAARDAAAAPAAAALRLSRAEAPLVVVSGSCSPMTARQIRRAVDDGFRLIEFDPRGLEAAQARASLVEDVYRDIAGCVAGGTSVIVSSCDGRPSHARQARVAPATVAKMYAALLTRLAAEGRVRRFVVAGGDVSSFTIRALGVEALEMVASASPGVPLCKLHAPATPFHGLEVALKGGQLGGEGFFAALRDGTATS